ncbi:MAG TPA: phosphoglucosamine mutase [Blastocatellia bacterium]|nr:phosphoglucosamine mutase [Blastocatellia bacterium]
MREFFGTDGIRGVAGQFPLDEATIERIGWSLARELTVKNGSAPLIVTGRDTRESGEWIETAIARGIAAAGGQYRSAGVITTPGVAYLTRVIKADAGVVISASHNPYQDNGIKVFAPSGQKLDDATEEAIERDLKAEASAFPPFTPVTVTPEADLRERYLNFLRDELGGGLDLKGMRIVVDCANGASSALAPRLFSGLNASVTAINADPNGRNINLDCGSLHPEKLQQAVSDYKADLGIAFDGDADRSLFVDERGNLIDGDQVLFVMATYLAARNQLAGSRVVATVMSNLGLELGLKERGITLTRTSVGDKYVLDELLKNGGSIGGEQSGHLIFPGISLAGDGMITAIELLRAMSDTGQSLGALTSGFTRYPQVTINVKVARKPPLNTVAPVKAAMDRLEAELEGKGRLLVRYSGTENLARVMIEGQDERVIRKQAEEMAQVLKDNLGA